MKKIVIILFLMVLNMAFSASKIYKDCQNQLIYNQSEARHRAIGINDENFYKELKTLVEEKYYQEKILDELYSFEVENGLTDGDFKELYQLYSSDTGKRMQIHSLLMGYFGVKYTMPQKYMADVMILLKNKSLIKEKALLDKYDKELSEIKDRNKLNIEKYMLEEQKLAKKYTDKKSDKELQENSFNYLEEYRNGNSYENAIKVGSVQSEYNYLGKIYGKNLKMKMQELESNNDKNYDVITVVDNTSNKEMKYYFDISSFFGKRF